VSKLEVPGPNFITQVVSPRRDVVYLASSFVPKNLVNVECGLSALEVPRPFFVQGYISVCGDTLYSLYISFVHQIVCVLVPRRGFCYNLAMPQFRE
jgi:hypothetical protein